ncbi:MAG: hypothetical protein LAP38_11210 [Acidobacteriia bacterium]|nr:hypothetical protein [Terriglobia bacterium]
MKTTVEIPEALFRQAKASAAQRGISLKDLFAEALREKLRRKPEGDPREQPWMRAFGGLRKLRAETKRVNRIVHQTFEEIDEDQ